MPWRRRLSTMASPPVMRGMGSSLRLVRQTLARRAGVGKADSLTCCGPAFGKCQRACAEWASFALSRPWLADRLDAVAHQACTERRYQNRAYAVRPPRLGIRLGVDQQRFAHAVPGEGDIL